jgi:hypothetical protein
MLRLYILFFKKVWFFFKNGSILNRNYLKKVENEKAIYINI